MISEAPLPHYESPPVEEVALGVYFDRLVGLRATMLGKLAERWREPYPELEEHPELPPVPPEIAGSPGLAPRIQFQPASDGALPRCWFRSADGARLLQLQRDRLVHNWRRTSMAQPYPHYQRLLPNLADAYRDLESFAREEGIGPIRPTQCEVTYVNPVPVTALGSEKNLAHLVTLWSGATSNTFLPEPEDVRMLLRYPIRTSEAQWIGRLYLNVGPEQRPRHDTGQSEEVVTLQLFARGKPLGDGWEGARKFFDIGHEWVVRAFASVTTVTMQREEWGLTDG